jgi:hypothetical protein
VDGAALRFDVSHSFVVRDKTFPAGKYVITPMEETDGSTHMLKLQSEKGKEFPVFDTMDKILTEPSKNTELVFDQAGGEYILKEIRVKGDDQANQILETKSEKRAIAAAAVE